MFQLCLFKCQKNINMPKRSILSNNIYIFNRLLYEEVDQWGHDDVRNHKLYENLGILFRLFENQILNKFISQK